MHSVPFITSASCYLPNSCDLSHSSVFNDKIMKGNVRFCIIQVCLLNSASLFISWCIASLLVKQPDYFCDIAFLTTPLNYTQC